MIHSWVTTDPNLTTANEIMEKINTEITTLQEEQTWLKRIEKEICSELKKLDQDSTHSIQFNSIQEKHDKELDLLIECQICMEEVGTFCDIINYLKEMLNNSILLFKWVPLIALVNEYFVVWR